MRHFNFLSNFRWFATIVLLITFGVGSTWGTTTYKLTSVTSVSAGNKYVFVEDGHALTNTGSKKINSTTSFSTSALTGSESYVYLLESATGGYKLKNCSTATYLSNSSADMSLNATGTVWYFTFSNGVALIQNYGSDRFIGETSAGAYTYKAYAYSNLDTYAHDIYVYRLDEEASCSANPSIGDASLNGSFSLNHLLRTCSLPAVYLKGTYPTPPYIYYVYIP